jgi:hypothetical protein
VLHRLQTTLFHDQAIDTITRPGQVPVRQRGWAGVAGS